MKLKRKNAEITKTETKNKLKEKSHYCTPQASLACVWLYFSEGSPAPSRRGVVQ